MCAAIYNLTNSLVTVLGADRTAVNVCETHRSTLTKHTNDWFGLQHQANYTFKTQYPHS